MSDFITVQSAEYVGGLSLRITFSDGYACVVDFNPFFIAHPHPQYAKYFQPEEFQKFSVESGNVIWGKDWDLIFPVQDLYSGKLL